MRYKKSLDLFFCLFLYIHVFIYLSVHFFPDLYIIYCSICLLFVTFYQTIPKDEALENIVVKEESVPFFPILTTFYALSNRQITI